MCIQAVSENYEASATTVAASRETLPLVTLAMRRLRKSPSRTPSQLVDPSPAGAARLHRIITVPLLLRARFATARWASFAPGASRPRLSRQGRGNDHFSDVPMDDLVHGLFTLILSPDRDGIVAGSETEDDGHAG